MRYANGKLAWGECARSGRKMLHKDMVRDGYHPNLMVEPAWYESRHPQEILASVEDPIALRRPTADYSKPPGEGTPAPDPSTLPFT
jgi:hypothetical protein